MSIRALKLKTGEEVIADIEGVSKVGESEVLAETVVLGKPMSVHMIPSEEGIGLQLLPFALYAKNHGEIAISKDDVMFCVEVSTGIRNQYASMTGLPTIPDDSIIIPGEGSPSLKLST